MFLGFSSFSEAGVYFTCILLGIAMLMPMNAVTSAPRFMVDYYKYVSRDEFAVPEKPVFWANILTFYNIMSVTFQVLAGPFVLTPWMRRLSLTTRFVIAVIPMMVELIVVVTLPVRGTSQTAAMVAFLIVAAGAGAGKATFEVTCYALVSSMPPKFMSAVMFGCAFSGVTASTLQCIIKASMPDTYESALQQSHIYFSLALVIMALSILLSVLLRYNSFAQDHVGEYRMLRRKRNAPAEADDNGPTAPDNNALTMVVAPDEEGNTTPDKDLQQKSDEEDNKDKLTNSDEECRVHATEMTTSEQLRSTTIKPILRLIYPMQVACFCIFFLSLFIFPSLVIPIDRTDNWFATIAILLYNCGDATGRFSTSFRRFWPARFVVVIVSFVRFLFLPLIFLCIYKYIPGHAAPYVFMFFIGLTKGYFGALSMVLGPITPGLVTDGQKVMAGQLMGVSLLAGASAASMLALLVVMFLP
ncbi:putative nucleobase transporter [Trypanosoma theileri]|uniref:Putative nucleobase transporter n=1 Tax=Trypanosoma theileri TaxID=67003 RepID=A0A1X0NN91_9TRYP|nr:putative nucleobase transporter [Trypanosoma theileri]ORC86071.1 putative nucleobase transporter [Trypanosoma theileri]